MSRLPFWSDELDIDLLKILPETEAVLGRAAEAILYTRGSTSRGRLHHPVVWNAAHGSVAYFGTVRDRYPEPSGYVSTQEIVEATLLEALRSAWFQRWTMVLGGRQVWTPFADFWAIIGYKRSEGWHCSPAAERDRILADLTAALAQTAEDVAQQVDFAFDG